jgi:hypothetical protein
MQNAKKDTCSKPRRVICHECKGMAARVAEALWNQLYKPWGPLGKGV